MVYIVALRSDIHRDKNISKQVGVSLKPVHNVLKRYKETGSTATKPISGRSCSVRTKMLADIVREKASRNPGRSMSKMQKPSRFQEEQSAELLKKAYA